MRPHEARRDLYRRMAHEQGYRSRAAYKLKELNTAYRVIGAGFDVLDVGCAPGGWTQVAVQNAGNRGRVMGIDLAHTEEVPGAYIVRGDITDETITEVILEHFGKKINAVVCDLSPRVTGTWSIDHAAQISLNYNVVKILPRILSRKGHAVFKVFDGDYSAEFHTYMRKRFVKIKTTKPMASRKTSSEMYMVCMGYSE